MSDPCCCPPQAVGAPAPEPSTSGSQGKKKPQPAKASDPYANYSHAATLNMVDQEYEDAVKASKEAQTTEGNVGKWEAVGTTAPAASTSSSAGLMADPEAHLSASQREEMRPSSKTFKEKTIDDDELWDPATTIRLKPKPAVKKEESPAPVASGSASASGSGSATPAEGEKKPNIRAGFKAAFNKVASNSPGPEVARDSPLAQEDTPVKAEPQHTVEPPVQAAAPTVKEESPEAKPSPAELDNAESSLSDMAPRSMFKKRKAGGSSSGAAQRRKM